MEIELLIEKSGNNFQQKPSNYWTFEKCKEVALQCKNKSEMQRKFVSAYNASKKHKWFEKFSWSTENKTKKRKARNFWSLEKCKKVALECNSLNDFKNKFPGAYQSMRRNGWKSDIIFKYNILEKPKKWTFEKCYQIAKNFSKLKDFKKEEILAYNASVKYGYLKFFNWLERKEKFVFIDEEWTKERCIEEALKFSTRTSFMEKYKKVYLKMKKYGWDKDESIFNNSNNFQKWYQTDCVYVYRFDELKIAYIGRVLKNRIKRRDYEHSLNFYKKDSVASFCKENNLVVPKMEILQEYENVFKGKEGEKYWLSKFLQDGWYCLNKIPAGSSGAIGGGIWNYETCFQEALKYKSKNEFILKSSGAYRASLINDWLKDFDWFKNPLEKYSFEDCYNEALKYKTLKEFRTAQNKMYNACNSKGWLKKFDWLKKIVKPKGYWTYDTCKEESKKYSSIKDFKNTSKRAYSISAKNGWIEEFVWLKNSKKPRGYWTKERSLEESKKYSSFKMFATHSSAAYSCLKRLDSLNEITWFTQTKKPRGYWTYERCMEESKKYKTLKEFRENNKGCYESSIQHGWIEDFTWITFRRRKNI